MTAPTVLVSSRDAADVPHVAGVRRLAAQAERHGWTVRVTYALAEIPERRYANGAMGKPAHRLATVAVRLRRDTSAALGIWHHEGGGHGPGWRFSNGFTVTPADGFVVRGAKALLAAVAVKP